MDNEHHVCQFICWNYLCPYLAAIWNILYIRWRIKSNRRSYDNPNTRFRSSPKYWTTSGSQRGGRSFSNIQAKIEANHGHTILWNLMIELSPQLGMPWDLKTPTSRFAKSLKINIPNHEEWIAKSAVPKNSNFWYTDGSHSNSQTEPHYH